MIAKATELFRQTPVIRCDHAALASGDGFARVKAETAGVPYGANMLTVVPASEPAGGVFNDPKAVLAGDLINRVHISGEPEKMYGENRLGSRRNLGLQLVHINVEGIQVDVTEHNPSAEMLDDVRRGYPGKGWNDDFIARLEPECCQRQMKTSGAGRDGDRKFSAREGRPFFLKFPNLGTLN
jgi:hypothetical protein